MRPEVRKLLFDALEAAREIQEFVQALDRAQYVANRMVQAAVERKFEIIGEALNRVKHLDDDVLTAIPEHGRIIGFRNIISHGYDTIEPELVWDAIENHLPSLKRVLEALLSDA
ncbi:MAG: HepT-like ribonuclease domain-containing protein [Planctomycetota bacterium]|jgi:uncharacterized protein with HEPN domain